MHVYTHTWSAFALHVRRGTARSCGTRPCHAPRLAALLRLFATTMRLQDGTRTRTWREGTHTAHHTAHTVHVTSRHGHQPWPPGHLATCSGCRSSMKSNECTCHACAVDHDRRCCSMPASAAGRAAHTVCASDATVAAVTRTVLQHQLHTPLANACAVGTNGVHCRPPHSRALLQLGRLLAALGFVLRLQRGGSGIQRTPVRA